MKALILSVSKALVFLIGLGWTAHYYLISEIKGQISSSMEIIENEKKRDVSLINSKLNLLNGKIDRQDSKLDGIINILIKERRRGH